jgi:Cu/Ag efflux pump CusA
VIVTPTNAEVPLGALAKISFSKGPAMIRERDRIVPDWNWLCAREKRKRGIVIFGK